MALCVSSKRLCILVELANYTDSLAVVPALRSLLLFGPPTSSLGVKFGMDRSRTSSSMKQFPGYVVTSIEGAGFVSKPLQICAPHDDIGEIVLALRVVIVTSRPRPRGGGHPLQSILQQGDTEKIIKIITILSIIRAKYFYDQKIIIGFTLLPLLVLCEGEEDLVPTLGCGKETAKSQGSGSGIDARQSHINHLNAGIISPSGQGTSKARDVLRYLCAFGPKNSVNPFVNSVNSQKISSCVQSSSRALSGFPSEYG
ncbi:hypothetical protein An15g04000 [Aspergillus niger]|uniref:Uncharacterized protein n=2 Tax=Aspergillus niger TaxID=5061 RepID=A5ABZ6_ASPNC|nr:hypothetical protein An15g04000 [Aspergillus niger]CAK97268.1 hypothetical protein An15g04000 [Aspergillus niger]